MFEELLQWPQEGAASFGSGAVDSDSHVFSDDPYGATWLRPDTMTQRWLGARETLRRWCDAGLNLEKKKAVVAMARL